MNAKKITSIALTAGMLLGLNNATIMADGVASLDDIMLSSTYSDNFTLPTVTTSGEAITWSTTNADAVIPSGDTAYVLRGLAAQTAKLTATANGTSKSFNISVPAFEYSGTPLFAENFEGGVTLDSTVWQQDAAQEPNTSDQNGAQYMGVATVDGNGVYMIKRTAGADSTKKSYIHLNTPSLPGNTRIIYEADVCATVQPTTTAAGFANYWLCRDTGNAIGKYSSFCAGYIGGAKGVSIKSTSGSSSTTIKSAVGKWHNIKFDVTPQTGVFDAYVDESKVADDYALRATTGYAMRHLAYGMDGNMTGELLLDNVKYYVCPNEASNVLETTVIGTDDVENVIANVTIPSVSGVKWVSSNPAVVAADGTVNRANVDGVSEVVTLYGIYSEAGMSTAKAYTLTVIGSSADEMDEAMALDSIEIPSSLTASFDLPSSVGDFEFTWTSSNTSAIRLRGNQAIPVLSDMPNKSTLTATVQSANGPISKKFVVKVPPVMQGTAYVDEDFENISVGSLPTNTIDSGAMWRRRNETDTFGVSDESASANNKVLRLGAAECVLLNFDGIVNAHHRTHYLTFTTKTEGNAIANLRFLDVQDSNPASGHQVFNLLEGLYRNNNIFMLQAATSDSFAMSDNTWYDVVLKFSYDNQTIDFYAKKSTDDTYTLLKSNGLKYRAVPKKLAIWFDSGAGAHVYDNFLFYASDFVPVSGPTYSLVDYGTIEQNEARVGMYYQLKVSEVDEELSLGVLGTDFTITGLGSFDVATALTYAILGNRGASEDIQVDISVTSGETIYEKE